MSYPIGDDGFYYVSSWSRELRFDPWFLFTASIKKITSNNKRLATGGAAAVQFQEIFVVQCIIIVILIVF